jgi:cleavage and polyadenylation specificity factor subunit 4
LAPKVENVPKKYTWKEIDEMLTDAKYFIIKSSNQENIDLSRKYSEWATTKSNEIKLNEAYNSAKNVFLIFSVNRSAQYQGFARMCSPITNKFGHYWKNTETIKLGGCFKIEWITYANLNFNRLSAFTNPLNNNEPLKKSRDTQELPSLQGKEVCRLFEIPLKEAKEETKEAAANQNKIVEEKVAAGDESSSDDIFGESRNEDRGKKRGTREENGDDHRDRRRQNNRDSNFTRERTEDRGLPVPNQVVDNVSLLQNFGSIPEVDITHPRHS